MEEKTTGLYTDYIIHPGETLLEIIEDRNITQTELAIKTGVTKAHISNVVNGKKSISASFAKKLEYVLDIDSSFWVNLQAMYDSQIAEINDANNISQEEISVLGNLSEVIKYFISNKIIEEGNTTSKVLGLRRLFNISNLTLIPKTTVCGAFRASTKDKVDAYVLYAWLKMCELKSNEILPTEPLNLQLLKDSLPDIKSVMFLPTGTMEAALTSIFRKCGIAFCIVKNFKNAPVQGYIEKTGEGNIVLCMTIRQSFADIFWFTLFHEIAHILNCDYEKPLIDYTFTKDDKENEADKFARDILIDEKAYEDFSQEIGGIFNVNQAYALQTIKAFSQKNNVKPYIVIGRLQKERIIPYTVYRKEKTRYKWAED